MCTQSPRRDAGDAAPPGQRPSSHDVTYGDRSPITLVSIAVFVGAFYSFYWAFEAPLEGLSPLKPETLHTDDPRIPEDWQLGPQPLQASAVWVAY